MQSRRCRDNPDSLLTELTDYFVHYCCLKRCAWFQNPDLQRLFKEYVCERDYDFDDFGRKAILGRLAMSCIRSKQSIKSRSWSLPWPSVSEQCDSEVYGQIFKCTRRPGLFLNQSDISCADFVEGQYHWLHIFKHIYARQSGPHMWDLNCEIDQRKLGSNLPSYG